jgi:hypothetical protein
MPSAIKNKVTENVRSNGIPKGPPCIGDKKDVLLLSTVHNAEMDVEADPKKKMKP